MRNVCFSFLLSLLSMITFAQAPAGSPVAINGKLKVMGTQMVNECGKPVQLRGMSTHGPQWFENCYCEEAMDALVYDWGISVFRIAMYFTTKDNGYLSNKDKWKNWIDTYVDYCGERGIYCLIDWHVLNPGNPNDYINDAKEFWSYMSQKHANKKHVLYEICNEPNGSSGNWSNVKNYANEIIPLIRKNDPETIIIVGTPTWSQDVDIASKDKLQYDNIMYTLHFYAGTHKQYLRDKAQTALNNGIAIFATEFGTSSASGDGSYSPEETKTWINWLNERKISWASWSFADKNEISAALAQGACRNKQWNNTSTSGTLIKSLITQNPFVYETCEGVNNPDDNNGGNNNNDNPTPDNPNDNNGGNNDDNNDDDNNGGNVTYPSLVNTISANSVYRIINKESGKAMTAESGSLIQKTRDANNKNQLFEVTANGSNFKFVSADKNNMTNKYNPNDNADILLQTPNQYDNSEIWEVTKVADNVWFRIKNTTAQNNTSCIQANSSTNNMVKQATWNNHDSQMWGFELVPTNGSDVTNIAYADINLVPTLVEDVFMVTGENFSSVSVSSIAGTPLRSFDKSDEYYVGDLQSGIYIVNIIEDGRIIKRFSILKQ